jgi:hypothetical protein
MRVHHLIEYLKTSRGDKERIESAIDYVAGFADSAAQFDMGNLGELSDDVVAELEGYAIALYENGLLKLPFKETIFSYQAPTKNQYLMIATEDNGQFTLDVFFYFYKSAMLTGFLSIGVRLSEERQAQFKSIAFAQFNNEKDPKIANDITRRVSGDVAGIFFSMCAILNAEGVETRVVAAPARLNKKRARQGKPLIGDIHEVTIRFGGKRYLPSGAPKGGGSRRMHWRRGHIRRLADGRVTNVRPALIGVVASEPVPQKPRYVVKEAS